MEAKRLETRQRGNGRNGQNGVGVELLWSLRPTDGDLLLVPLKNNCVCVCARMFMRKQACTTYVQVPSGTRREH